MLMQTCWRVRLCWMLRAVVAQTCAAMSRRTSRRVQKRATAPDVKVKLETSDAKTWSQGEIPKKLHLRSKEEEEYIAYVTKEWGKRSNDDTFLFELLALSCVQSGLSWRLIMKKRKRYREVYHNWNAKLIAAWPKEKVDELMEDAGIIRNRRKIEASIRNAQCVLDVQKEFGSLANYLWGFMDSHPELHKAAQEVEYLETESGISNALSKDMKKRGFRFVGPTVLHSYLQSIGAIRTCCGEVCNTEGEQSSAKRVKTESR